MDFELKSFNFKKKWGQNFLTDTNLLAAIASDAGVSSDTTVLEIGAGAGALTEVLAKSAKRVRAYEIDESLKPILRERLKSHENVELVFGDFQRADLGQIESELGNYRVVANLPYYITTPVILRFVEHAQKCEGLCVMVQEEVARRLCAGENTPEYGAITEAIARRGTAVIARKVPRSLFTPRPNVDSAVVLIDFTKGGFAVGSEKLYRDVVRCAFLNRRKTLENNVMNGFSLTREEAKALLSAAGIPEGVRGETLSPRTFGILSDLLFERS